MKTFQFISMSILLLVFFSLTACSSMSNKIAQDKISMQDAKIIALNKQLNQQKKMTESARMEKRIVQKEAPVIAESLFPPDAKTGQCYARVFVPHKMRTVTSKILKKEASERIEIIPAQYETVTNRVLREAASERLVVVPATYKWVEENMLVVEAKSFLKKVPAVYETATEKILISAAHTAWKKGTGPIQKIDNKTGEIMCLVEIPAVYKTVSRQILKSPARTVKVETPAKYKMVEKQIMATPPDTRAVKIPAKYQDIKVVKLVKPTMEKRITIPEEFQTVTKKEVIENSHMKWVPILCQTNMTYSKIKEIQAALQKKGCDPGLLDGVIGVNTMKAVNKFQEEKGLLVSKNLTIDTMNALGVLPK